MKTDRKQLSKIEISAMNALADTLRERAISGHQTVEGAYIPQKTRDKIMEIGRIETPYGIFVYTDTANNQTQRILFLTRDEENNITKTYTLQRMEVSKECLRKTKAYRNKK